MLYYKSKIEERVKIINGCWIWQGAKRGKYGKLTIGSRIDKTRKNISAHRYSWLIYHGEIPDGLFVCHKCDNPLCVNPDHLFLGTRQDNVNDREFKNRNNHFYGEKSPTAKLKTSDIIKIKELNKIKSRRIIAKEYGVLTIQA